jgi:hypothetical protein
VIIPGSELVRREALARQQIAAMRTKKKGESHVERLSPFFFAEGLEVEAKAELNPARSGGIAVGRYQLSRDHAETGPLADVKGRVLEVDMGEDVEEVGGEAHRQLFGNGRLLSQGEVKVPEGQPADRPRAARAAIGADVDITEAVEHGVRVGEKVHVTRSADSIGASYVVMRGVSKGARVNGWDLAHGEAENGSAAPYLTALRDEVWEAAECCKDPGGKPAAQDAIA